MEQVVVGLVGVAVEEVAEIPLANLPVAGAAAAQMRSNSKGCKNDLRKWVKKWLPRWCTGILLRWGNPSV